MSDATLKLGLPFILPAQAQKHVTHNEALQRLDAMIHLAITAEASTPSVAPADGSCYLVGNAATDAWTGQAGKIALFQDGLWQFIQPVEGWSAWFVADAAWRLFDGDAWISLPMPTDGAVSTLGINASADTTNRLAVSSPATLLNNAGAGHQLKINKAHASDTASLLYQTGWSGRAEMGLSGSDMFAIKVSQDGANWFEALKMTTAGVVLMPQRPLVRAAPSGGAVAIADNTHYGFDTLFTNQGGFSLGSAISGGGSALIFPVSGYYAINLTVTVTAAATFSVTFKKNTSENAAIISGGATDAVAQTFSVSTITYFSAGDTASLLFSGSATYQLNFATTEVSASLL